MFAAFKHSFDFAGRASRKEYWLFTLLVVILSIGAYVVDTTLWGLGSLLVYGISGPLTALLMIITAIPGLSVTVRRLHDKNMSGWWIMLAIIPLIGALALLVIFCLPGTPGDNRFGPNPLNSDAGIVDASAASPSPVVAKTDGGGGFALAVLAVILLAGGYYLYDKGMIPDFGASKQAVIGQAASFSDYEVTVESVREASMVGSMFINETASEGGTLIVVNYSWKNTSSAPLSVLQKPTVQLRDGKGTVYNPDFGKGVAYASANPGDNKALSDLNPGLTVRDSVVFDVSKSDFDPNTWTILLNSTVEVALVDKPAPEAAVAAAATPALAEPVVDTSKDADADLPDTPVTTTVSTFALEPLSGREMGVSCKVENEGGKILMLTNGETGVVQIDGKLYELRGVKKTETRYEFKDTSGTLVGSTTETGETIRSKPNEAVVAALVTFSRNGSETLTFPANIVCPVPTDGKAIDAVAGAQPTSAVGGPRTITNPTWLKRPTGSDFEKYYPTRALDKEKTGRVVLNCIVAVDGTIDCIVADETPDGWGFGEAALKIAKSFQMSPRTVDGKPTAGGRVSVPIVFNLG